MKIVRGVCGSIFAASAIAAAGSAFGQPGDILTRRADTIHCDNVAAWVVHDLREEGREPSLTLTLFKQIILQKSLDATRAVERAGQTGAARPVTDIHAEVRQIRERGKPALHAELRRCWVLFEAKPVPDDLI